MVYNVKENYKTFSGKQEPDPTLINLDQKTPIGSNWFWIRPRTSSECNKVSRANLYSLLFPNYFKMENK